jgi:anti-sigma-K factor RskA
MESQNTTQCELLQPWLAAYALGEAEAAPAALGHLSVCPRCRSDLREYRAVAGLLPYGQAEHEPAPELRDRLLAAVASEAKPAGAAAPASAQARGRLALRRPALSRAGWAAATFATIAVLLLGWNIGLQRELSQQSAQIVANRQSWQTMIALLNDESLHWYNIGSGTARGHFWSTAEGSVACLVAEDLPALAPGQVFQVWLAAPGEQRSGGTFEGRNGNAWLLVESDERMANYSTVFVTIEPEGGSAAPSGPRVLDGGLTAGAVPAAGERWQLLGLLD